MHLWIMQTTTNCHNTHTVQFTREHNLLGSFWDNTDTAPTLLMLSAHVEQK